MIVVEGPDGSGKTTLVQQLAKAFHLPVAPKAVDHDQKALMDLATRAEQINRLNKAEVHDRHTLISELIYSPIFRDAPRSRFQDQAWYREELAHLLQVVWGIVICLPPLEVVRQNVHDDPLNASVSNSIDQVYWAYHNVSTLLAVNPYVPLVLHDYTKLGPDMVKQQIQRFRERKGLFP